MDFTVDQSKAAFAGHEWWVIGDGTSGVYPQEGHLTLLAADNDFGTTAFRTGNSSAFTGSTYYYSADGGRGGHYANNPDGMTAWTTPNEYAGSTLQQKMAAIAEELPEKEQAVIRARDLTDADGIAGQAVSGQKMWALSESEWNTIRNDAVKKSYGILWWLRTPFPYFGLEAYGDHPTDTSIHFMGVDADYVAARPALSLNLESVFFPSAASEADGKSAAAVGDGLVGMETPSSTVKFTMKDSSQTLTVHATPAQSTQSGKTLSFTYSNAATGTNQYVSCVLTDPDGSVSYYGKLADSSGAASGSLSVPLAGVADGTYTLQIFSEEANGALYTDFCSEPVTMTVTVADGSGTVSDFGGTVLHEHSWSDAWSSDDDYHWHNCTADGCPIAENSQKDGYAAHTHDQQVVSDAYLASAATCTDPAEYHYSCVCGAAGTETFPDGDANGHSWGAWRSNGDDTHTRACQNCPAVETEDCTGGTATCADKAVCDTCGEEYGEVNASNHTNLVKTEAKAATHLTEGNLEYWRCDGCGRYFSDAAGTKEIDLPDTVIPKLTDHTADGTGWHSDETGHWNTCVCGEKMDEAAHRFAWVIDREAAATEAGSKHEECTVCGYQKAAVEIPAAGTPSDPSAPGGDDPAGGMDSPKTGDGGVATWFAVMLAACAGLTVTLLSVREKKRGR